MRRTLIALLAVAAVFAGPAAAQAGPAQEQYVAVQAYNGTTFTHWFWIDEQDGIIGCEQCDWMIDLAKSVSLPAEQETQFQQSLMAGLAKLSDAKVARDPRTADALRRQAMDQFLVTARSLGSATARIGVVGYYDSAKRAKIAAPRAWLSAADQDLADGLSLLQRSFADPSPQPWINAAAAQFDEAYAEIAGKKALGG